VVFEEQIDEHDNGCQEKAATEEFNCLDSGTIGQLSEDGEKAIGYP